MRPRVFINIATNNIGGPGKGLLQFLQVGGLDICDPVVVGFSVGNKNSQFDLAMENIDIPFERLTQKMTYDPFLLLQAVRIIKKYKPNILQSHGYKSHLICLLLKHMTGIPWIAFFHGWISEGLKINCYNNLEKILLGFADRVVPVSQSMVTKLNLKWIGDNKVRIIHNAVDPEEYHIASGYEDIRGKYGVESDDPLVAVIGRLSPEKGHVFLIDALPRILKELPRIKVMFVGEGRQMEILQKMVNDLNLAQTVIFTGYQNELGNFYRDIDLLVLPSLSEGMPNVALEAMLHSKSVLATRVGGIPEVVLDGKTGMVVDSQNSEQLADAIMQIFRNPDELRSWGLAGRERVLNEFDPIQRVKKIADLYGDVLTVKGAR